MLNYPPRWEFLSTLSLRRATRRGRRTVCKPGHFYPRSPCGERRGNCRTWTYERLISIHALLAESDMLTLSGVSMDCQFLSTLSLRRATASRAAHSRQPLFLSTLSLRRATTRCNGILPGSIHFYPRSPCGERPDEMFGAVAAMMISIHALLAESDNAVPVPTSTQL